VGTSIIDERSVKTLKSFRLVVLNSTSSLAGNTTQAKAGPNFNTISSMEETTMKTSEILLNPLTLTKLAYFLTDAMREAGKVDLPFVCAVLDKHKETYMVVGVDCADREGSVRQNQFGKAFNETADATRARVRQDRFDTSVVEIARPDLTKFMEHLQLVCQK
jgi:cell division control protein 45